MSIVNTDSALRERYGRVSDRAQRKVMDHLDRYCRQIIELSPFCVLGTSNADGHGDVSPRGGAPGFVRCIDERTLALPDASGNNRLDSLSNVVLNPEVALMFMVPGLDEVLRVNGRARLSTDPQLCAGFDVGRRTAATVMLVDVREAFLHCAKAVMRARIWESDTHIDRSVLPSIGQMIKEQTGSQDPAETQEEALESYRRSL